MPEECPVEATFDAHINYSGTSVFGKKTKTAQPNDNFKVTLCTHWLLNLSCPFNEDCHYAHGEEEINEGYQPNSEFLQDSSRFKIPLHRPKKRSMGRPKQIGLDMLLTTYRKPPWQWQEEIEKAERNIRLSDPASAAGAVSSSMEYYPGSSAYFLPPDVLFAPSWVERAGIVPNEKGWFSRPDRMGKHGNNAQQNIANMNNSNLQAPEFYTGDLPGFVVCAATAVVEEMFRRSLFGLPVQMQDIVIHPNVPLFVFDSQAMLMLGIFYADSTVGLNLVPTAFVSLGGIGPGGGSPLPVQFKFRMALECPPISLMDPELMAALGGSSPMGAIAVKETRAIANLFAKRSPAFMSSKGAGNKPPGPGGTAGPAGNAVYKPPFKFNADVPIDLLVDEVGSKNSARVRMRGVGSGFVEGHQELQEPLMFSVSADSEQLLQAVV
eukprot:gene19100-19460_t